MSKSLSQEEIQRLLKSSSTPSRPEPWPSDENLKRLAIAVEKSSPTVVFDNGLTFSINYAKVDRWGAVFVKPFEGDYVPCGYINLSRLKGLK